MKIISRAINISVLLAIGFGLFGTYLFVNGFNQGLRFKVFKRFYQLTREMPDTFIPFFEQSKILYWKALVCSVLVGLIYLAFRKDLGNPFAQLKQRLFNKEIWLHPSSLLDVKLIILNYFMTPFILITQIGAVIYAGYAIYSGIKWFVPDFRGFTLTPSYVKITYVIVQFIVVDFFRFYYHYFLHNVPFLQAIHDIHHSATVLTPLTILRRHFLELIYVDFFTVMGNSIVLALFLLFFPGHINGWTIVGTNLLVIIFNHVGANLQHSAIPVSFGPLEHIFVSPRMHQIHHSVDPKHFGKNIGFALSIWDRFFGTLYIPDKNENVDNMKYGLPDPTDLSSERFLKALIYPLRKWKGQ